MNNHPDKTTDPEPVESPLVETGVTVATASRLAPWQVIQLSAFRTLPVIALVLCDNSADATPFDTLLFSTVWAFVDTFFRASFCATNLALTVAPSFDVDGRIEEVRQSTDHSTARFQDEFIFKPF